MNICSTEKLRIPGWLVNMGLSTYNILKSLSRFCRNTVNSLFIEVQGTCIFFRNNRTGSNICAIQALGENTHFDISGYFLITEFD